MIFFTLTSIYVHCTDEIISAFKLSSRSQRRDKTRNFRSRICLELTFPFNRILIWRLRYRIIRYNRTEDAQNSRMERRVSRKFFPLPLKMHFIVRPPPPSDTWFTRAEIMWGSSHNSSSTSLAYRCTLVATMIGVYVNRPGTIVTPYSIVSFLNFQNDRQRFVFTVKRLNRTKGHFKKI